jgi:metal-responsive CopG/Arc/MetJ family transcriptional regulator
MAKVMVSIPDDLLARLDEYARARGTTRSGLLRELAERELAIDNEGRRQGIARLLAAAESHGGRSAQHVRDQRQRR